MASSSDLVILAARQFEMTGTDIHLLATQNHGLLVLQSQAEALFFDSSDARKNHQRWRENAIAIYQYFKRMWPNIPLPPEVPGTKSSAHSSRSLGESRADLVAPSQSMVGFDYLLCMSVQRLMKTELHAYQRQKAARSFHALITLMCKTRPVLNLQRLGDNAIVSLQLGDSGYVPHHCLWTDRVLDILVADLYSKLQCDYHDEEDNTDWFPNLRSASSLPIATYLLLCLSSRAPEMLQTYGLRTLTSFWDHAKDINEVPKWTFDSLQTSFRGKRLQISLHFCRSFTAFRVSAGDGSKVLLTYH